MATTEPKIRLFNVKFSPNLGDGLLSECLEEALIELGANQDTWSIDLAERKEYGDEMMGRALIMSVLENMPGPVRRNFIRLPLAIKAARSWRPHYAQGLRGSDAVVIGGGNLISDIDLNFPTKLTLAVEESERLGLPVIVYASGVTSGWTKRGERMLRDAFRKPCVKGIFVRDADSKAQWDKVLGEGTGHQAIVVRDPGLLAKEVYSIPTIAAEERAARPRPVAGLGVMSHIAIRYHAENAPERENLDQWYVDVARGMIKNGYQVRVFTNGSPEDRAYAETLREKFAELGDEDVIAFPTQKNPKQLCEVIADFDVLIAYRMHAVIAAYSCGVPAVGLAWDRKLHSFMKSVGREQWFRDVTETSADECVELAIQTHQAGIPEAERLKVLSEARDGVQQLYDLLKEHL